MRRFREPNRNQMLLFANVNLHSVAPIGSAVRAIDDLVERLDTSQIEEDYDLESPFGQNPIHPKTIIKVSLFALHNCRFSLRKMEYDTGFNLAYRWLTGDETIDHSTIGKFLSKYKEYIIELFSQTVLICVENELVDFDILAIDTVKIRANASYKQTRTIASIEKEKNKIKKKLSELLDTALKNEETEAEIRALENRKGKLENAGKTLEERIALKTKNKSNKEKEKIEKNEKINITDVDAHIMQQANGEINPSYSITTTTNTKSDIITNIQVNVEDDDPEALIPAIDGSKENTGKDHVMNIVDPGFSSIDNLEELENNNIEALIPDRRMEAEERDKLAKGEYDRSKFNYDSENDKYICPEGEELNKVGEVKLNGRKHNRYANPQACGYCKNIEKCTKASFRIITRDQNEKVKELMREKLKDKNNKVIYKKRAHASESPYGQIKHNLKFKIFMRRGIEKIRMEMALLGILHNGLKVAPCF